MSGAQQCQAGYVDMHHKLISFELGDFVLLSTKHLLLKLPGSCKLKPLWVGLYQIVCACGDNAYKLELTATLAKLHPVFNVTLFKHCVGDIIPDPDPIKLDNGPEQGADAILDYWWVVQWCTHIEYLASFVVYDTSHNEWLLAVNLANTPDILRLYQNTHGLTLDMLV